MLTLNSPWPRSGAASGPVGRTRVFDRRWVARRVVGVTGACVVAVGVGVLMGWMFAVPLLKAPLPDQVQMKANTALGFVALGLGLLLTRATSSGWRGPAARALAALAVVIGALTLVEYLAGHDLGIDQLLFRDTHGAHTAYPGRLAPQSAGLFVLLGSALWMLNGPRPSRSRVPRAMVGTSFVIAMFAVIGYGYGASGLRQVSSLTPMALYSALTVLVLCVGIAAADPRGVFAQLLRSEETGSVAAKRLLPIAVVALPVLGWLQIQGGQAGLYSGATGVALFVVASTALLFVAVLSLTKRLSRLDVLRQIGIASESRLAALIDATNDAVLSSDMDWTITTWNRAAEELYGYASSEALGRSMSMLSSPASLPQRQDMLQAVIDGEPRTDIEVESLHRDGSPLHLSLTVSRIMQGGVQAGFCSVAHSIEGRIRARDLLEDRVLERTRDLASSRAETLQRLALAAEYRDDDTAQHTDRVGKSAAWLARALGLPSSAVELIGQAAPLHDVGKIGIPDNILLKPGSLSASEFELMKAHTTLGASLLAGSDAEVLQLGEQIALSHHERWDGAGYPNGLAGEAIPIAGRIVAIVDAYDAMTNDRPYRASCSPQQALTEIRRCSGHQFDPRVTDVFLRSHSRTRASRPPLPANRQSAPAMAAGSLARS